MLDELKQQIAFAKRNIKSENSDYLTGYTCALSAVEGMIAEYEENCKMVDADKLIKKLDDRISEFIKKQHDKKNSEPVVMMQELMQMLEREAENEE